MIRQMFQTDRPEFVRFAGTQFRVGDRRSDSLRATITDMQPTRKLFLGTRLACWSNDAVTAKDGRRCALCRDRWDCAERLRLMLLIEDAAPEPLPAILEIGHGSFELFERFLAQIDPEPLAEHTVLIGIDRSDGQLRLTFRPIDC